MKVLIELEEGEELEEFLRWRRMMRSKEVKGFLVFAREHRHTTTQLPTATADSSGHLSPKPAHISQHSGVSPRLPRGPGIRWANRCTQRHGTSSAGPFPALTRWALAL
jgi:hypothetical protein